MKLVSVDSVLKQLQNDSHFVRLCLILLYNKYKHLSTVTGTLTCKCFRDANCEVNLLATAPILTSLLTKRCHFTALFNVLSTDTSFIKIGICYQELSSLDFNFSLPVL